MASEVYVKPFKTESDLLDELVEKRELKDLIPEADKSLEPEELQKRLRDLAAKELEKDYVLLENAIIRYNEEPSNYSERNFKGKERTTRSISFSIFVPGESPKPESNLRAYITSWKYGPDSAIVSQNNSKSPDKVTRDGVEVKKDWAHVRLRKDVLYPIKIETAPGSKSYKETKMLGQDIARDFHLAKEPFIKEKIKEHSSYSKPKASPEPEPGSR